MAEEQSGVEGEERMLRVQTCLGAVVHVATWFVLVVFPPHKPGNLVTADMQWWPATFMVQLI